MEEMIITHSIDITSVMLSVLVIFIFIACFGGVSIKSSKQKELKKDIDHDVKELIDMINTIHARSTEIYDDKAEAITMDAFFTKQIRRLEILRNTIQIKTGFLYNNEDYKDDIEKILEVQLWLLEKYDDPTVPKDKRHYIWLKEAESSELQNKTKTVIDIATKLKINEPVTIK